MLSAGYVPIYVQLLFVLDIPLIDLNDRKLTSPKSLLDRMNLFKYGTR